MLVKILGDHIPGDRPKAVAGVPTTPVHRLHLPLVGDAAEIAAAWLMARGALGTWERPDELVAWFEQRPEHLGADLDLLAEWQQEEDRDWQAEWKATIEPVVAARFVVVPSWLADGHAVDDPHAMIVIDPGRAFGTGHHATTTMCLELLDEFDRSDSLAGRRVADVGCGSGILSIAAARLGGRPFGVDTDPAAVAVTSENAIRNSVDVAVAHGSVEMLDGPFAVVMANIVTDVIASMAGDLTRLAGDDGTLIVSGISVERRDVAMDALTTLSWTVDNETHRDGWVGARLSRPTVESTS